MIGSREDKQVDGPDSVNILLRDLLRDLLRLKYLMDGATVTAPELQTSRDTNG